MRLSTRWRRSRRFRRALRYFQRALRPVATENLGVFATRQAFYWFRVLRRMRPPIALLDWAEAQLALTVTHVRLVQQRMDVFNVPFELKDSNLGTADFAHWKSRRLCDENVERRAARLRDFAALRSGL